MSKSTRKYVKELPILGTGLRYLSGNFIQHRKRKKNTTFFNFKANIKDEKAFQITKLNPQHSLYRDRFCEVKRFFKKSTASMLMHYVLNGTPNTSYYKFRLHKIFKETGVTPERLKKAYEQTAFMYVNRLMLRYHKYELGERILAIAKKLGLKAGELSVLDYGCGVADPSLYLAFYGAQVCIVDLDDLKFDFAISRFSSRNLQVKSFGAKQTEIPVEVGPQKYDFIIMAELLEHVRNPRKFLEFAIAHLDNCHGVLYDSLGPTYNHSVGGDHLAEAKQSIESSDYTEFHSRHLIPLSRHLDLEGFENFYVKTASDRIETFSPSGSSACFFSQQR